MLVCLLLQLMRSEAVYPSRRGVAQHTAFGSIRNEPYRCSINCTQVHMLARTLEKRRSWVLHRNHTATIH